MDAALPQWLAPQAQPDQLDQPYYHPESVKRQAQLRVLRTQLEHAEFETLFDRAIEHIADAKPLTTLLENDPRKPHLGRFVAWVMRDEKRKAMYREAQQISAEVMSHEIVPIADADNSAEDVARSAIRISARHKQMAVNDRERFGDVKKVDQTITIDLGGAMERAQERLEMLRPVEVQTRVIEDGR